MPSSASFAKVIVDHIAPTLKDAGFRKQRNAFNRQLENGLIHHFSLRLMSATGSLHGKFCFEAGCYVPAAERYSATDADPKKISISNCCILGHFVKKAPAGEYIYLDAKLHANDLTRPEPYVAAALDALERVRTYEQIMSNDHDIAPLHFSTPKGIVQCCVTLDRGDQADARQILADYLESCAGREKRHLGHEKVVTDCGKAQGLM